jgi:hypothetical protein
VLRVALRSALSDSDLVSSAPVSDFWLLRDSIVDSDTHHRLSPSPSLAPPIPPPLSKPTLNLSLLRKQCGGLRRKQSREATTVRPTHRSCL